MLSELDELDSSAGWVPYFQKLNWIAKENAGPQKISKLPENRLFNRYRDVLPFDSSRVVLKEGETDYINANLVEVPSVNRRYILTQGPLKNTATHFWQMVWEQKTEAIIMLNRVIEKNQLKCHQYWPCGEKVGHTDVLEFGYFRITYIEENMSEYFTVRKLEIFNMKEEEKRNVFHFHYLHWPDFGVPTSPATFLSFLFEARNTGVLSPDVGPSVIHCSAGIGRSGTFIMVDSILKEVEQTRDLNGVDVKTALLEIRRYRVGLIQTPDQLRFTYAAILEGTRLLMPQVYEEALEKFLNEREPEEEVVSEEDEVVPPPVPARKRQEVDQPVDKEANIAPKRKRSLPDIPTESTSDAAETPKETTAAATPHASKDVSSYQGFQADNLSSDESDGEDEIIDLSASSSSSSEQSEEDRERLDTKEEPTTEHEKYTKESEEQGLRGESKEDEEEDSVKTEISHKTEEENIEMEEEEELEAEIEVQEDFAKIEGETNQEVEKATMERERETAAETTVPRKAMESRMVEREEFHDKLEDKEKTTEETAKSGKAKTKEVRKEGKRIDAGQSRAVSKETESRIRETEDLDRLRGREEFAKETELTAKRDEEARKEREKKIDKEKTRAIIKELESRMEGTEALHGKQKEREATEVTAKREEEARKEREKKIDRGKSRPVSKEIESRMGETEGLDRLKDRDKFAKVTEVTARDKEARKEREKKIDAGKSRTISKEMKSRMEESEELDRLKDREEFAKATELTAKRDEEARKERERKIDRGKSRPVSKEIESRMGETEKLHDRLQDRDEFAKATEVTARRDEEARKERERKIDRGKSRPVGKEIESRMGETEGLDRLQDRDEIAKSTKVTARRDEEARKERERKIDRGKSRPVGKEIESRMGETKELDRLQDRDEIAKSTKVTARRDKEARKEGERERKIDAGKSRLASKEIESRMGEIEALHDKEKDREEFVKTTEETLKRGKAKDTEVRKERKKKMDTGQSRFVSKEMETRMEETEKPSDTMKYREDFTETRKETPQKMEIESETSPTMERQKVVVTEIAIQTSLPFMEEEIKIDVDKEPSTEMEVELISKESIGIQACSLDTEDIVVVIDRNADRKIEGKEKPSSKKEDFLEEYKEKELISKEKVDRITEKEEVKEVITTAVETGSSVEQQSDSERQKIVDKSKKLVKTEDKLRKPLIEAGKITLTGPALVLEKMNAIKIQEGVVSKPAPQPMESGSDIMESGHGAYARITMAEKTVRSRDEPSNESIGGSIGTNPRKSETEIQSREKESDKKVSQVKAPDDNPEPSTSKESVTELRRRQRQEKKEKTEKLVKDIKGRVEHEESTRWIRKIIRNSLIVIGVCAAAYIAYRCYRYFYRIPRRKFRRF